MFEARHGRGALDSTPVISRDVVSTPFGGIAPSPSSTGMKVNPRTEVRSTNKSLYPNHREHTPMGTDLSEMRPQVVSQNSGHIIGEGAMIFMDMTETMLDALDWQMALSAKAQEPESSLTLFFLPIWLDSAFVVVFIWQSCHGYTA